MTAPVYRFRYGDGIQEVSLRMDGEVEQILPRPMPAAADPAATVQTALRHPIGAPPLPEALSRQGRIAILVNDATRVARTEFFLPLLVEELTTAGVRHSQILVVVATGTHRPATREEERQIMGPLFGKIPILSHRARASDMAVLGRTSRGTEVALNKKVVEADSIILTGSILYHFFAGYGGGRKCLFPGVGKYEAIQNNHRLTLDPAATFGRLQGNPVHEDIMEVVKHREPDFLLNTILNDSKEIVRVVAGHYREAHEAGCTLVDEMYGAAVPEPADLVIASCGGYPRDINLFQAHKTLENAARIVRPGGVVILVAECRDGIGPEEFVRWLRGHSSAKDICADLERDFEFGAHKAYFLAQIAEKAEILLVSSLPAAECRGLFVTPFSSAEYALAAARERLGSHPRTYLLPEGGLTFPRLL